MKKTIKILGLIFGCFCVVSAIICLYIGIYSLLNPAQMRSGQTFISRLSDEQYLVVCIFYLIMGSESATGAIFNFILSANAYNEKLGKGPGITLGVFGIVLGAPATGVLTIVDSAMHRH